MKNPVIPDDFEAFNVPGNQFFLSQKPLDVVVRSVSDLMLKGYWIEYDEDGQLMLAFDQSNVDGVSLDYDPDGTPVLVLRDTSTTAQLDGTDLLITE